MKVKYLLIVMSIVIISLPLHSEKGRRGYLISGQNSAQKIFYETSSSFSKTHRGRMAMDSDYSTAWLSDNSNDAHWLVIDFGVKRLMTSMAITPGKMDNYHTIRRFKLQFFYRNAWFDFKEVECEEQVKKRKLYREKITIDLGGVDASKFRIFIPEGATYNGYAALAEVEVFLGTARIRYYDERLKGFLLPVKNGFLPQSDHGYPNAPRAYRGGRHVGLDIFYYHEDGSYDPIPVTKKTPILAAESGVVIRADYDYVSLSPSEWKRQSEYYQKNPHTFDARSFGGMQVWIDHGNGIVTTYNHMSAIDSSVKIGAKVKRGQPIGYTGNTGLLGDAEGKDWSIHLHFEIWIDAYYLGYGMGMDEVKNYILWIFFPTQ